MRILFTNTPEKPFRSKISHIFYITLFALFIFKKTIHTEKNIFHATKILFFMYICSLNNKKTINISKS